MSNVPPDKRTTSSGIEVDKGSVDYGVTATVTLSRKGMGMMQRKKGDEKAAATPPPPPPAAATSRMPFSVASDTEVACPKCKATYPITPEVYGFVAECEGCSCEFLIKAPGAAPARPAAPAPRPAAPAPRPAAPAPAARAPSPGGPKPAPPKPKKPATGVGPKPAGKKKSPRPKTVANAPAAAAAEPAVAAVAPASKGKSNALVIGLLVVVILVLGAVVAFLVLRGGG